MEKISFLYVKIVSSTMERENRRNRPLSSPSFGSSASLMSPSKCFSPQKSWAYRSSPEMMQREGAVRMVCLGAILKTRFGGTGAGGQGVHKENTFCGRESTTVQTLPLFTLCIQVQTTNKPSGKNTKIQGWNGAWHILKFLLLPVICSVYNSNQPLLF